MLDGTTALSARVLAKRGRIPTRRGRRGHIGPRGRVRIVRRVLTCSARRPRGTSCPRYPIRRARAFCRWGAGEGGFRLVSCRPRAPRPTFAFRT